MTKQQILKALQLAMIMTAVLVVLELVFMVPQVEQFFVNWFNGKSGWMLYAIIWVLMFLQCNVINIPAVTLIELSNLAGIETLSPIYILVVMSAYMSGCIVSYFLGAKIGSKAVKWVAGSEQDFAKWCDFINRKGKWWYFATVILPIFPDDVLCIVAGSLKFNFGFYCFANAVGRSVGLVTMIATLKLIGHIGGEFPTMLIVWSVGLVAELVAYLIIKNKVNQK